MRRGVFLVGVVAALILLIGSAEALTIAEHFYGDWRVEKLEPFGGGVKKSAAEAAEEDEAEFGSPQGQKVTSAFHSTNGTLNFVQAQDNSYLSASYTPAIGGQYKLEIRMGTTPESGNFKLSPVGNKDEESAPTCKAGKGCGLTQGIEFDFALHQAGSGAVLAQGPWKKAAGEDKEVQGSFTYVIPTRDQFVLTVQSKQSSGTDAIITFVGRRSSPAKELSPLQKYGPTGLIVVAFIGVKFFMRKAVGDPARAAQARRGAAANAPRPKVAAKPVEKPAEKAAEKAE